MFFKKCKPKAIIMLIVVLAIVLASSGITALANDSTAGIDVSSTQITVRASAIKQQGTRKAIQAALDIARYSATNDNIYRVVVEKGEYDLSGCLHIYSNTTLVLNGVKLTRNKKSGANMLRTGDYDTYNSGAAGYDEYCNMTIEGGVFDGGNTSNTVFKAAHSTNLTIQKTTFKNVKNGHIMEIAGVNGFHVLGCTFKDQTLKPNGVGYEAIQLDILKKEHIVDCRSEALAMKNVVIENCTFENCPRGIGTHTMILNNPFDGIKIRKNTFKNMTSAAIQGMNWKNCEISGNTIEKTPRGISVYSLLGSGGMGAYKASAIAAEGKTNTNISDSYQGPYDSNIVICNNTITGCGSVKDQYAAYEPAGISIVGEKLTKVYKKYDDGSGALPKGDYSIKGVTIKNNVINVKGYGIRLIGTKDAKVQSNTLSCGNNRNYHLSFHGIQLYESSASAVSNNSVSGAPVNGIDIYAGSVSNINGNEIDASGKYGIIVKKSTVPYINANTIFKPGSDGILFTESKGNKQINENYISQTGGRGIYVKGKSTAGSIAKNTIFGCARDCIEKVNNCKGTIGTNYFQAAELKSLKLNVNSVVLGLGESFTPTMTISPSNARSKYIWTSSDSSVVSVDGNGKMTAKKEGKATVTVKSSNGITAVCEVEVKKAPDGISLNSTMLTLGVGEQFDLNSKLYPAKTVSHSVKYTSNNAKAASVNATGGMVTANSVGTATVVARTFNGKIANCNIIVKTAPYAVWFDESELALGIGESYDFTAILPDETASNQLVYASDNSDVLEIDAKSGHAEAKATGTAIVTAETYNGLKAVCEVTVLSAPERIDFAQETVTLAVDESLPLERIFPEGSTAYNITYQSSDPGVCHIDKTGTVTAKAEGTATISARTYNGRIAFCKIICSE